MDVASGFGTFCWWGWPQLKGTDWGGFLDDFWRWLISPKTGESRVAPLKQDAFWKPPIQHKWLKG